MIALICFFMLASPFQAEDINYGDLTGSGNVVVGDAIMVLRYIVGLTTLSSEQLTAADVNGDGDINVADAITILRFIVGLIDSLPHDGSPLNDYGVMEVHFIDVGQGDSILIITPGGKTMLIDAGTQSRGNDVLAYLRRLNINSIDIVVGTHAHADHIGGLITVMEELPVGKLIDSGKAHTTVTYNNYLDVIDRKNIPFVLGRAGDVVALDPKVSVKVLHPGSNYDSHSLNDASVVIKVIHGNIGFLFTGDAEEHAEAEILARNYNFSQIDILKVGHHGSSTSTSRAFFNAISPTSAVIMCGTGNTYGHPHDETLNRLANAGVNIYRTDINGDILITSNGLKYNVDTEPFVHDPTSPDPDPSTGTINLNSASYDELLGIIHIGPIRAEWIIGNRPFSSVDDLIDCPGIGPARLQDIKDEGKAYVGASGEIYYDEAA